MIIELLYPSISALYGEKGNIDYLKLSFKDATFIETDLNSIPYFVNHSVDFVFMGPTTERFQKIIIDKLMPYKERIIELINHNTYFLITGNAVEIFGSYIIEDNGNRVNALDLFPFYSKQDLMHRFNSYVLAEYNGYEFVGFKSQFTRIYPTAELPVWLNVKRGIGFNKDLDPEGIKFHNFYGTHCLGPILVMNPMFTKELFNQLGYTFNMIPFEDDLIKAFKKRVLEFKDEKLINYP